MQGEAFLISQVGMTYFRCCDGRLLGLTIKNTQTFVVTVVQEPLALHVGTFRFHSLYHNSTRAHAFSVIQRFIEAFDEYHFQPARPPVDVGATSSAAANKPQHSVKISVKYPPGPLNSNNSGDVVGVAPAAQASSGDLLNLARSSSLIMHEVSKIESWNRMAQRRRSSVHSPSSPLSSTAASTVINVSSGGVQHEDDPTTMDAAGIGLRETVYLATEVAVDVAFKVFDTMHHITLDLRPVPGSPAIVRELFVWNFLMDAFRANAKLQEQVRCLTLQQQVLQQNDGAAVASTLDDVKIRLPSEVSEAKVTPPASTNGSSVRRTLVADAPEKPVSSIPSAFDKKPERKAPRHHPPRTSTAKQEYVTAYRSMELGVTPAPKQAEPSPSSPGTSSAKAATARPPSGSYRPSSNSTHYMRTGRPGSAGAACSSAAKVRPVVGDLRSKAESLAAVLQAHEMRCGAKADANGLILTSASASSRVDGTASEPHEQGPAAISSPRPTSGRAAALGHIVALTLQGHDGAEAAAAGGPPIMNLIRPTSAKVAPST